MPPRTARVRHDAPVTSTRVPPFAPDEYAARLAAVQAAMAQRSLSLLVVVDPANLNYLTGYDAWSFYMPQTLLVPAEGSPHLLARAMDAAGAHYTALLDQDHIHGYPEHYVHREDIHPWEWIAERAVALGLVHAGAEIALEMDSHYFSPRAYLSFERTLRLGRSGLRLVDSRELVNWVRVIKSPAEREQLRRAGRIATHVMRTALETAREGVRQCDVVAAIQSAQARGVPQAAGQAPIGGDYPAIVPMLPTGETADTPHLTWTERPLVSGEATTIELAGVSNRYHAPLARTVSVGPPPGRLLHCAGAVDDGLHEALARLHPGSPVSEVHRAFAETIGRHGLTKESRIGYSIGIGYPPDWGERTVSLRSEEETVLAEGMAFHLILGMWMDGWGYETSESLLVGPGGPELLTDVTQGLFVAG